jgi:hypothetical protein
MNEIKNDLIKFHSKNLIGKVKNNEKIPQEPLK